MFYYLDDWLIVAESRSLLLFYLFLVLRRVQDLGFLVNWKKSSLEPQRVPVYLGAVLDIPRRLARPTEHTVVALQNLVQELSSKRLVTARRWQVFLGHLVSMVDLVPHCRLLMRHLQIYFLRFLSDEGRSGKVDSVLRGDLSSCVRVGVSEPFVGREAVCSETTRYYSDDRCVNRGLGSSVFNAPTFRSVVSSGIKRPHQLTGIEGCGSSSPRFRTSGGGPISSDSVRQQYCRGVHKSSRGNSFDSLMYDGPVVMGVVHPEGDASVSCSHFRDGECSSGLPFQGKFFVQRVDAAQGGVS